MFNKFDIITFGSATEDIVIKPKKLTNLKYEKSTNNTETAGVCFPFGSKIDVEDLIMVSGGGGTNTAATFALQGFKTAFCGVVGDDVSGLEILRELKSFGVKTHLVVITREKKTNHSIVILGENQDRTILAYRGAAELLSRDKIPFGKLRARWFYLAPLTGLLCDSFEDLVNFAKKQNIKVAVNPGMAQLSLPHFSQIVAKVDLLILNQEEASFLTKIPFDNEDEIFEKIDQMCPGVTMMTKGSAGVLVSDGKNRYFAKPHPERVVVDTTGAGDSFASGFLSEFMKSADIEKSIQLGMANAEGCLSKVGAKNGLLKKGQMIKKVEVIKNTL